MNRRRSSRLLSSARAAERSRRRRCTANTLACFPVGTPEIEKTATPRDGTPAARLHRAQRRAPRCGNWPVCGNSEAIDRASACGDKAPRRTGHQHLGKRRRGVLHARRRRDIAAAPGARRSASAAPEPQPAIRAGQQQPAINSSPISVIHCNGASVASRRPASVTFGAHAETPLAENRSDQRAAPARSRSSSATSTPMATIMLGGDSCALPGMLGPGSAQKDRAENLDKARHRQGTDQGQAPARQTRRRRTMRPPSSTACRTGPR